MKLIHCILSMTLAGALAGSLLPVTSDAACVGGTCTSGGGAPAAPTGGGVSGGGGGHHGGGWGGVAAGAAAGIVTGIITQQMMQQRQAPVYEEPPPYRRVPRRTGGGNGAGSGDDVGDGKAGVSDTFSQDPALNMYAQAPSDTNDMGIASDAGSPPINVGPTPLTTGSVGPAPETTASVGASGPTTDPRVQHDPPKDYVSIPGHGVKWGLKKGVEALIFAIPYVGPYIVTIYEVGDNGKKIKTGVKKALDENERWNQQHNEDVAPSIDAMRKNAEQGRKPFGSDLRDPTLFE